MKNTKYISIFLLSVALFSCDFFGESEPPESEFNDIQDKSIYDYIIDEKKAEGQNESNAERFSVFLKILEVGGLDKTLSVYNPNGNGYTLFLPSNEAIDNFINTTENISSIEDILNNVEYAAEFARYHVVNKNIHTNDFPFGAFPEPTLSKDYLTVSFIVKNDSAYYKINNQAAITRSNIEVSNGYIHEIEVALKPITFTSYEWLQQNSGYSIFNEAVKLTGVESLINFNLKEENSPSSVTLLIEPDVVYQKYGINSIDDLIQLISPTADDYTNATNPLHQFCTYHMLVTDKYIDDFVNISENYSTLSDIPLFIDGNGKDLLINKGKQVFDTIVSGTDTTYVDYIKFMYDESNILTQSGVIHLIDRIMKPQIPSRKQVTFQFIEEDFIRPLLNVQSRTFIDQGALDYVTWKGGDLYFVDGGKETNDALGADYVEIFGDFKIAYELPKIVQGRYTVTLQANQFSRSNAMIEVFIDGKKLGGFVDLTSGGTVDKPFEEIELGAIDLKKYESHIVEVRSLIQGRFAWDFIRFKPL